MSSGVRVSGFKGPLLELRTTSALMSVSLRSSAESGRILKSDEMGNDAEGISVSTSNYIILQASGQKNLNSDSQMLVR